MEIKQINTSKIVIYKILKNNKKKKEKKELIGPANYTIIQTFLITKRFLWYVFITSKDRTF